MFPLTFFFLSPYVIIMSAASGIINGSAMIFGMLFLFSIVFSRIFCGWLCPGGAVQDNISRANNRNWNSKGKNLTKYIIWVVWFSFIVFLWVRNRPLKEKFLNFDIDKVYMIIYAMVMTIIFLFTLFTGKRGMCHSLCWMAPFMVIGEKIADFLHIPRFRLKSVSNTCISCGKCSKICPMGIDVAEMVKSGNLDSSECINCLECVDSCPNNAIRFGIYQKQQ
jgi:polyferredoxin